MADDSVGRLELSAMVQGLRQELESARSALEPGDITFDVQAIEIEATVQIVQTNEGRAGVKFYVLEAGGSVVKSDAATQRVRLTLAPTETTRINSTGRPR